MGCLNNPKHWKIYILDGKLRMRQSVHIKSKLSINILYTIKYEQINSIPPIKCINYILTSKS